MKIKVSQQTNIIDTEESVATLNDITSQLYHYVTSYTINMSRALKAGGHVVNISVATSLPNSSPKPILTNASNPAGLSGLSFGQVTSAILTKNATIKDAVRNNRSNYLYTIVSDFTSRIPNDKTAAISHAVKNSTNIALGQTRKFMALSLQDLATANVRPSVLETPLVRATQTSANADEIRNISNQLIHDRGVDPASLLVRQNAVSHSKKVHAGTTVAPTSTKQQIEEPRLGGRLIDSLNQTGLLVKPNTQNLSNGSMVVQPILLSDEVVTIFEKLDLAVGLVGISDFYLIMELVSFTGTVIQSLTRFVEHGKNVAALTTPRSAPNLTSVSVSKIGTNVLEITQNDNQAVGVNVYRKTLSKSQLVDDAEYSFLGRVALTTQDGTKKIEDLTSNFNPIIYRAIPYGKNNTLCAEFASVLVKGQKLTIGTNTKEHGKNKFVSMGYQITEGGIEVSLQNVPVGVVALSLLKRDLTSKQIERYVGKPLQTTGQGSVYRIVDAAVSSGRIYLYRCKMIYKDGSEESGSNELIINYVPEKTNVINTRILNSSVIQNGDKLDVQFDIESSFIDSDEDVLRRVLGSQNLLSYFGPDITKEKLQSLAAYGIVRTNISTGLIEDFGVVFTNKFSDIGLGEVRGVTLPQPGQKYSYDVTTFLRTPATALQGYEQQVTDVMFPSKSFSYTPWNWRHPVTLQEGNFITQASLQRNHAGTQFTFGEVGKITTTYVSLENSMPSLLSAKATKINQKTIRVQWKIQGSATKIDHFIVMMDVLGMRTVVGKSHNVTETNYFEFIDSLDNGEKGELKYVIIPVYFDYGRGKETQTNKVLI